MKRKPNSEEDNDALEERSKQLIFALEEIEGKVMSLQEVIHLGCLRRIQQQDRPMEELLEWRGNPILHFKWNKKGELKTLKLYAPPSNT